MCLILISNRGGLTEDPHFNITEQSLLPVDIKLMPSLNNIAGAKSVTIQEQPAGTVVAEGPNGFSSSYDVYLRPCSKGLLDQIEVTMLESVPDQIDLSANVLTGDNFTDECKAVVEVSAFDDDVWEGIHYVNIQHVVKNRITGEDILLSDNSSLFSTSVLVQIYDDDVAGVIISETNGITATAEIRDSDKSQLVDAGDYEDEYSIRLTKRPKGNVGITLSSLSIAADQPNGTPLVQVHVNGNPTDTLSFTQANWDAPVTVRVTAVDDGEYHLD